MYVFFWYMFDTPSNLWHVDGLSNITHSKTNLFVSRGIKKNSALKSLEKYLDSILGYVYEPCN